MSCSKCVIETASAISESESSIFDFKAPEALFPEVEEQENDTIESHKKTHFVWWLVTVGWHLAMSELTKR